MLIASDRHGQATAFQLLLDPVLDDRLDAVSMQTLTSRPLWNSNDDVGGVLTPRCVLDRQRSTRHGRTAH
jgi:hypothetical protein